MLKKLSEQFILNLASYVPYNINIMDHTGTIIASKDRDRIGTVHEIAYKIILNKQDIIEVEHTGDLLGVRSGINMAVHVRNDIVGVIGITGPVEEVRHIARIVKVSFETMLQYEFEKEERTRRIDLQNEFVQNLLYNGNSDYIFIEGHAQKLGYRFNLIRVIVLIVPNSLENTVHLLNEVISHFKDSQNIITTAPDNSIVLCYTLPDWIFEICQDYKENIRNLFSSFCENTTSLLSTCRIFVSVPQKSPLNYSQSYRHCYWLSQHLRSKTGIYFFADYIDLYLKDQLPLIELHKIFSLYSEILSENFLELFMQTISALYLCDYNIPRASNMLNMHKNTLSFHIQKIKSTLNINPIQNIQDRFFCEYFLFYLQKKFKKQLSFR